MLKRLSTPDERDLRRRPVPGPGAPGRVTAAAYAAGMSSARPADERDARPELHPALEHLAFLVGAWRGLGVGGYPTIDSFRYEQEVEFGHDGRPFLSYSSRSWIIDDDARRLRPGASEVGWWRPGAQPRDVEVLLAHHTGIVEVYVGEVVFSRVELATDVVARTATAKAVTGLRRLYGMVDGDLAYAIDMAAQEQPLQSHLSARLIRV